MNSLISRDEIGNSDAAQDLYGLGVRLGFYIQALSMIVYIYGDKKNYGKGLKIASGTMTISVLTSWFSFVIEQQFSPSEAIVVLMILIGLIVPAKYTLLNPNTIMGEMIGVIALLFSELALCTGLLWTFSTLVHTLPRLGTPNLVFFFYPVSLTGWFRYLALVYFVLDAASSLYVAYRMIRILHIAWECYMDGRTAANAQEIEMIVETIKWNKKGKDGLDGGDSQDSWNKHRPPLHNQIMMWLNLIFMIVAVETTLVWNHLTPLNDLRSPGQLIPFVTGIILLIDSVSVVGREYVSWYKKYFVAIREQGILVGWLGTVLGMPDAFARLSRKARLLNASMSTSTSEGGGDSIV
ncbi:hypothetical protein BDV38DRAFT_289390 [Aspergillus pseudotamarii]|uniref:Uncharacterized protein n=1 Tax=Aspergillus pseudotamarii TaxID=132259 RepID=A0A5N6S7S0_ASPPS|nr:uncharacterized protein BDV38DRAFT_289390 [Aspergillus pseudotamarii]KAE8130708.1 hypothetical protein BDV38DRAFT_289390 [Aspergillus pseudotamarii]